MHETATGMVSKRSIFNGLVCFNLGLLKLYIGSNIQGGLAAYPIAVANVCLRIQSAEVVFTQCHTIA